MTEERSELNYSIFLETGNLNRYAETGGLLTECALAFNNRGHIKYLQVDFDAAVDDYNKAIDLDPQLAVAYYNRGTVYYRLGYFDKAVKDFQHATTLEPKQQEFRHGLEACLRKLTHTTQ